MKDLMIDIETLDIKDTAVIVQAAFVEFDIESGEIQKREHATIVQPDIDAQLEAGRTINYDTLKWWLAKDKDIIKSVFPKTVGLSLTTADMFIYDKLRYFEGNLWSAGSFDFVILEDFVWFNGMAKEREEYLTSYKYNSRKRDFRTLRRTFQEVNPEEYDLLPKTAGSENSSHDAYEDAKNQADWVIRIFKELQK